MKINKILAFVIDIIGSFVFFTILIIFFTPFANLTYYPRLNAFEGSISWAGFIIIIIAMILYFYGMNKFFGRTVGGMIFKTNQE